MSSTALPLITALFLVIFDQKVGYTIAWHRSLPNTSLEGVEFKALPSGLHEVKEDLVYFRHGAQVGVSAFVQAEADAQHRNASFAAVGALIPLSHGTSGKAWLLAPELRRLARFMARDAQDKRILEACWGQSQAPEIGSLSQPSAPGDESGPSFHRTRDRTGSDITSGLTSDEDVGRDHPALCMPELLDTFGPLTFPLVRTALVRQRTLLLGSAPVQQACNFVYVLSILANLPPPLRELVQPVDHVPMRMQPLFSVGISDIDLLSSDEMHKKGWLACTTDDILREKHQLYDVLVTLPSLTSTKHRWPIITTSSGEQIKATQRDLRRYRLLRTELNRIRLEREHYRDHTQSSDQAASTTDAYSDEDTAPLIPTTTILNSVRSPADLTTDSSAVEPLSWTAMAYNGFLWWASAGEMQAWDSEETQADRALFDNLPEVDILLEASSPSASRTSFSQEDNKKTKELHKARATAMVVTAYFHRLTTQMLSAMAEVVEAADDETEDAETTTDVRVSCEEMRRMGLDPWSARDRAFVEGSLRLWFGKHGGVDDGAGEGTRVCGIKIC